MSGRTSRGAQYVAPRAAILRLFCGMSRGVGAVRGVGTGRTPVPIPHFVRNDSKRVRNDGKRACFDSVRVSARYNTAWQWYTADDGGETPLEVSGGMECWSSPRRIGGEAYSVIPNEVRNLDR
ncbi:MAG: hypothetical protein AMXMBFR4_15650 [Candidatus Hydrogenedentota bacterium]